MHKILSNIIHLQDGWIINESITTIRLYSKNKIFAHRTYIKNSGELSHAYIKDLISYPIPDYILKQFMIYCKSHD